MIIGNRDGDEKSVILVGPLGDAITRRFYIMPR
jgi:hypothetical protein